MEFVQACFKLDRLTLESDFIQKKLKTINDEELNVLVEVYVEAWKALEEKIQRMEQEVEALLPDDSDF